MGAVPMIEDELRTAGAHVVYAAAPTVHGIAVYFWRLTNAQNEPRFIKSVFH